MNLVIVVFGVVGLALGSANGFSMRFAEPEEFGIKHVVKRSPALQYVEPDHDLHLDDPYYYGHVDNQLILEGPTRDYGRNYGYPPRRDYVDPRYNRDRYNRDQYYDRYRN